jgi:hypothetical protein
MLRVVFVTWSLWSGCESVADEEDEGGHSATLSPFFIFFSSSEPTSSCKTSPCVGR